MAQEAAGSIQVTRARLRVALGFAVVVAAAAIDLPAQPPAAPPAPPAASAPPGTQRGGGRGRGVQVMTLTTPAWPDGGQIPAKHAQPGGEVSPPLAWSNVPETAASFVLIVHDLDAVTAPGTDTTLHWLVWNIPGPARALPEGVPQGAVLPDGSRQISVTGPDYRGPGAPASGPPHHYVFELYAVDAPIDVPAVGATPAQTRAAVMAAMAGKVRGKAVYTGMYKRP
jgi:Raf kinase inhibitor-like YbhB/YbcL family protein